VESAINSIIQALVIKSVSIIGAGNVAHNLARMFNSAGVMIDSIYSREMRNASTLAALYNANPVDQVQEINDSSDLLLFAVRDDVLAKVASILAGSTQLMAHTSGSVDMDVFGDIIRPAVFYPLQTFSKEKKYDGPPFPVCIEAKEQNDLAKLSALGASIVGADNVYEISSPQRKTLHVAAVFACNFTNYFYGVAENILKDRNMSFDILKPLIVETVGKIDSRGPAATQTGPAARGDHKIINNHLEYLSSNTDYQRLYKLVTDLIISNT